MHIRFIGATKSVTGSRHLLVTSKGRKILLDCGLYQDKGDDNDYLNRELGFDPWDLDAVILSHAHIDHSGGLPYLVKSGYKGPIYATPATRDVAEILLQDSAGIQEAEASQHNKRRSGQEEQEPLYGEEDVTACMKLFKTLDYDTELALNDEVSFYFTDAGHILGSAAVHLTLQDTHKTIRLTFTGDVGRYYDELLEAPHPFSQADYIISESTYGNRLHDQMQDAEKKLLEVVHRTCVEKKGKLIIPAFSLGRTQEIVYALDKMYTAGKLPKINVYVDSPLSCSATDIMRKHLKYLNKSLHEYIRKDPDPFGFEKLHYVRKKEDSMRLNDMNEPAIIIASSGMMEAGRIKHHAAQYIDDPRHTFLFVGYCSPGSLGGKILRGDKKVYIHGVPHQVQVEIDRIDSYSAHADYSELLKFLSCQDAKKVKKIFLVHGEDEAKLSFRHKLEAEGYKDVVIPSMYDEYELK